MSTSDKSPDASFLSRWSRRKVEAKNEPAPDNTLPKSSTGAPAGAKMPETPLPERTSSDDSQSKAELPSIDTLTHEADFSPFMAQGTDPALRNQAMKKLFTDPHYQFEQMDKLDIYLDDYSKPDPIPPDMLRRMNQAWSLGLFDDEEKSPETAASQSQASDGVAIAAQPAAAAEAQADFPLVEAGDKPRADAAVTPEPVDATAQRASKNSP